MQITRRTLRRWGACYSDEKISTLVPESGLTPLEIAALNIPASDKLWVLLRAELVPNRDLRLLACDWAEEACRMAGWNDERSLNAIVVARRFATGEAAESELVEAKEFAVEALSTAWSLADSAAEAAAEAAMFAAAPAGVPDWVATKASLSAALSASRAARAAELSASRVASTAAADAADSEACEAVRSAHLADVVRVIRG